jgi:iron complex transport system permease protein
MSRVSLWLALLLLVAVPLSLLAGRVWIDPLSDPAASVILAELRLPRALLAVAIGAGLGASGAVMQGYLRNPLADPGLFGIAPGAALGAVLCLLLGLGASQFVLPAFALAGAALAMILLALIAGRTGGIALFTLAGIALFWLARRDLDALTLGEQAAQSLGTDLGRLKWLVVAGTALTVGAGVAVAGIIGFVGLIVPHLVRPLTDCRPSSVLLPSALAGALLVLVADSLCRILPTVTELRLGIVLSLVGAPFFFWLLLKMRRGLA